MQSDSSPPSAPPPATLSTCPYSSSPSIDCRRNRRSRRW
ncbi:hypothetical protein LINPERPRIM_LOCUS9479 [Linum perenne]